jgi:hypothetical protein
LAVGAAIVALSLVGVAVNALLPRTQAGEVAEAIADRARPGDAVVFCPDQLGPGVNRRLPDGLDQMVYPSLAGPERVDWVDYRERFEAASPEAVAEEVAGRAGPSSVWLVTSGGYNVSEHCAAFTAALSARRGAGEVVVAENPDVFEPALLLRFGG